MGFLINFFVMSWTVYFAGPLRGSTKLPTVEKICRKLSFSSPWLESKLTVPVIILTVGWLLPIHMIAAIIYEISH